MKTAIAILLLCVPALAQYNNDGQYQMRINQGSRMVYPTQQQVYRPEPTYQPQPIYQPPTQPRYNDNSYNPSRPNIFYGGGY